MRVFNGAALFQVRKAHRAKAVAQTALADLQWGRTFSSAERRHVDSVGIGG